MKTAIAITGPTGSGKTTVGEKLAKELDECVNIDVDHIKHMIVNGFYKDDSNPGGWSFSEWRLVGETIGLIAKNFQTKGFAVVINGYINVEAWEELERHVKLTHKFLLLPDVDIIKKRDVGRTPEVAMGADVVDVHYKYFTSTERYDNFQKLDTSKLSVEDTVEKIKVDLT